MGPYIKLSEEIASFSLKLQLTMSSSDMKVAYLGPEGTYTHQVSINGCLLAEKMFCTNGV